MFSPEDENRLLSIRCEWGSVIIEKVLICVSDIPRVEPWSKIIWYGLNISVSTEETVR
jgi:hypothetical protein